MGKHLKRPLAQWFPQKLQPEVRSVDFTRGGWWLFFKGLRVTVEKPCSSSFCTPVNIRIPFLVAIPRYHMWPSEEHLASDRFRAEVRISLSWWWPSGLLTKMASLALGLLEVRCDHRTGSYQWRARGSQVCPFLWGPPWSSCSLSLCLCDRPCSGWCLPLGPQVEWAHRCPV